MGRYLLFGSSVFDTEDRVVEVVSDQHRAIGELLLGEIESEGEGGRGRGRKWERERDREREKAFMCVREGTSDKQEGKTGV